MLPKYTMPQLTEEFLTDDIMNAALEREGLTIMPIEIARSACYQYMAHSAVWNEDLEAFEAEMRKDPEFTESGITGLGAVVSLAGEVYSFLCITEELRYREKHLSDVSTTKAMEKVGVTCNADSMSGFLAALAVGGKRHLSDICSGLLEANGVSADDVCRVAECYE